MIKEGVLLEKRRRKTQNWSLVIMRLGLQTKN
jgi:hypothetical protein